jgi:hypothetical protein
VRLSKKNTGAYDHAKSTGKPNGPFTVDRTDKSQRRRDNLKGVPPVKGKDRDEWPPAVFKEGKDASVRPVDPSQNRSSGAEIGAGIRNVPNGGVVMIDWVD